MTIGIAVTGDSLLGYAITLTGVTGDFIRVYRQDNSGHYEDLAVRGIDMVPPTGATMVVTDYEAPLNVSLTFTVEAYNSSDTTTPFETHDSAPQYTTVPKGFSIITNVLDTAERVSGYVLSFPSWTHKSTILASHHVLGRANPVIITDLFGGRTGQIVMANFEGYDVRYDVPGPYVPYSTTAGKWNTIFSSGTTLLFRSDQSATGFDDCYFITDGVTSSRLNTVGVLEPALMSYAIDFIEVDRPFTTIPGLGLFNYAELTIHNDTYADLTAKYATYQDITDNPTL